MFGLFKPKKQESLEDFVLKRHKAEMRAILCRRSEDGNLLADHVKMGEDAFAMPAFSDVHANGSPLADSVLGQSRFDNIGLLDGWRT